MEKSKPTIIRDSRGKTYCGGCGRVVSKTVEDFSIKKFNRVLCFSCQKKETK